MSAERMSDERLAELVEAADLIHSDVVSAHLSECLADALAEVARLRQIEEAARRMFDAYAALNGWKLTPVPPEIVAEVQEWCDSTAALHAALAGRAALPEAPQDQTKRQRPPQDWRDVGVWPAAPGMPT